MTESKPKHIVLAVKTSTDKDEYAQGCLVDKSKGLPYVLKQISEEMEFTVERLFILLFGDGEFHTKVVVKKAAILGHQDVVLAVGSTSMEGTEWTGSRLAAATLPPPKYKIGTKVRNFFNGHGWWDGEITEIDLENRFYKIVYEDDDAEEHYFDRPEIDEIVENFKKNKKERCKSKKTNKQKKRKGTNAGTNTGDKQNKRPRINQQKSLTFEQREQLRGKKLDMEEFRRYLTEEEKIKNVGNIVSKVEKLYRGEGYKYKFWPMGVIFHRSPINNMGDDFVGLMKEADDHEEAYGHVQDGSLKNSIQKLENYQKYCWNTLEQQRRQQQEQQQQQQQREQLQEDEIAPDDVVS